ncbi:hypothetical protein TW84_23255 [Vibrio neptunius]|uniref:hypothetical protein n=1 Tax=Vibrio neptunius TaxID=170651 RepID=UPI0005FA876A|nr:hypothetical protein [Vibrio neptunius]KJY81759.1 hypothetical protein TW84_23255 [Vibrio neptunius]
MDKLNPEVSCLLIEILGFRLLSVFALIHTFDGERDLSSPQELLFTFEGGSQVRIKCDQDGESIHFDNQTPVEANMAEYGQDILCDCSNDNNFEYGIGRTVDQIDLIVSDKIIFGLLMTFEGARSITIINLGDELYVYDELPKNILEEEKWQRILVD